MLVKILGSGCTKCNRLERNVKAVIEKHQLTDISVEKVTDLSQILSYGILMTPGLIIDEETKSSGIIPKDDQLLSWLRGA